MKNGIRTTKQCFFMKPLMLIYRKEVKLKIKFLKKLKKTKDKL